MEGFPRCDIQTVGASVYNFVLCLLSVVLFLFFAGFFFFTFNRNILSPAIKGVTHRPLILAAYVHRGTFSRAVRSIPRNSVFAFWATVLACKSLPHMVTQFPLISSGFTDFKCILRKFLLNKNDTDNKIKKISWGRKYLNCNRLYEKAYWVNLKRGTNWMTFSIFSS